MKIKVSSHDANFCLALPNFLVFNRLTASLITKTMVSHINGKTEKSIQLNIDPKAAGRFILEFKRIKKKYGRFTLVEVVNANGDIVKIDL